MNQTQDKREMSEEELRQQELREAGFGDDDIPGDEEVDNQGQRETWRFANGKIVTGKDATLKERPAITGRIVELRVYKGKFDKKLDNGVTVQRDRHAIECSFQTRDGIVNVAQSLLDNNDQFKAGRAAVDLAWALTQVQPGKVYQVTAAQGEPWVDPKGNQMSPSTYVNFAELTGERDAQGKLKTHRLVRPKLAPGQTRPPMNDQILQFEKELRGHPLWKERQQKAKPITHLSELCKECAAKGWPTPEQAPTEWLGMMGAFSKKSFATLADVPDDEWGAARQALENAPMPGPLEPVKARLSQPQQAHSASAFGAAAPAPAHDASAFGAPASASPISDGTYNPFEDWDE